MLTNPNLDKPKFEVICTTYNEEIDQLYEFCFKEIKSIKDVCYPIRFTIVFEYSEREKCIELKKRIKNIFMDDLFSCIYNTRSSGFPACLNFGIINSNADYIIRIDTDDSSINDRYKVQTELAARTQTNLSYSYMISLEEDRIMKYPSNKFAHLYLFLGLSPIAHVTICIKKDIFYKIGFYDEDLKRCEDIDFWLRYFFKYKFKSSVLIKKPLVKYRTISALQKSKENGLAQIIIRSKYLKYLIFIPFLFIGIFPNLLRCILPKSFLNLYRKYQQF